MSPQVGSLTGIATPPGGEGQLVFAAPWEGRVFALALGVTERLGLPWDSFRRRLVAAIDAAPGRPYYESWLAALEELVADCRALEPER